MTTTFNFTGFIKQILVFIFLITSFLFVSSKAQSQDYLIFTAENLLFEEALRKDNVPWPWGQEIDFPWRDAQGTYNINLNGQSLNISLRVIQPSRLNSTPPPSGPLFLSIKLTDAATCKTIGVGRGFQKGNLIRAQFVNQFDNQTYLISLHAFDAEAVKLNGTQAAMNNRRVMVASVGLVGLPQSGDPRKMSNSAMVRISNSPNLCSDDNQ